MKRTVTLEMLHEDIEVLKQDMVEIRTLLLEPRLKKEIIEKIKEARKRMESSYVTHDEMKKEFDLE